VDQLGLRLGLHVVGRLGSRPRVMGRLGSRVWVSASFQIFASTAGGRENVLGGEGNCPAAKGGMSEGEMSLGFPWDFVMRGLNLVN